MARWWHRPRKREPDPLGTGVWRRADDRFRRAVDRYHQVLDRVEVVASETGISQAGGIESARAVVRGLDALQVTGAHQADLLARVHEVCRAAQALAPSHGDDVPSGPGGMLLDVHRALARGATLVAQAQESATMVLVSLQGDRPEEASAATLGARRATEQASVHIGRAETIIHGAETHDGA